LSAYEFNIAIRGKGSVKILLSHGLLLEIVLMIKKGFTFSEIDISFLSIPKITLIRPLNPTEEINCLNE
jgi:hypothetical protein